ncbi:GGDEF domain-containing protein [Sideroxydans lithotrophicus]|uniref:Diguanylate cyclase n=1 Tax=Sideroxydans lithotrophicus (strain ES-1) TaxID=580332 RepID=D5CS56_SIDLE|nr:GGDEF domain-containing protein [Sideroxydans lithotrophicus]ADE11792.1 diguanylate cyclase [Sideroxydans lithotrophicus ES-1]
MKNSTLATLLANTTQLKLAAEQILLTPGQHNDRIYVVLSGRLRAQLNADDTNPLALFGAGECVGEMSMFDDNQVSAYVIAVTDCELLAIEHKEAWSVLNRSLEASHNLLALLANRIRATNRTLAEWQANAQSYGALNYVNSVTGFYNRHWLADNIGRLILRHTKSLQPCALILLKVDNFGQFAAGFGRLGSEQAQRSLAETLQRYLRPNDIAAEIEADQFAIFLPQTGSENASSIADRLMEELDQMVIGSPSGDAMPPVMLLIGVGQPQPDDTLDSLLARTPPLRRRTNGGCTH